VLSFALRMLELVRTTRDPARTFALALLSAHGAMLGLSVGIEALYQRHWWLVLALGAALTGIEHTRRVRQEADRHRARRRPRRPEPVPA